MPESFRYYKGAYSVELTENASTDHLPKFVNIECNTVRTIGTVQQVMGGIQFYAGEFPFSWGYNFIKRIRDRNGEILWENWNYRDEA